MTGMRDERESYFIDNNLFYDLVTSIEEAGAIKSREKNSNYLILRKYVNL